MEIQLALGTLFRRRGEIEKATQIHQGLISRPGTSSEQKSQVLFELANDYFKAGLLDRAENLLLEVGFLYPHTAAARMAKLRQLLLRAEPNETEVAMLRGMVRQLRWASRHGVSDEPR